LEPRAPTWLCGFAARPCPGPRGCLRSDDCRSRCPAGGSRRLRRCRRALRFMRVHPGLNSRRAATRAPGVGRAACAHAQTPRADNNQWVLLQARPLGNRDGAMRGNERASHSSRNNTVVHYGCAPCNFRALHCAAAAPIRLVHGWCYFLCTRPCISQRSLRLRPA